VDGLLHENSAPLFFTFVLSRFNSKWCERTALRARFTIPEYRVLVLYAGHGWRDDSKGCPEFLIDRVADMLTITVARDSYRWG